MFKLIFSKYSFRSLLCLFFFQQNSFAQIEWSLDVNRASNLSAGVYIQDLESVLFISGTDLLIYPINGTEQTPGSVTNFDPFPAGWDEITAAVLWNASSVLLFNGENYVSLDINQATLSQPKRFPGLPDNWNGRLDAAVNLNNQLMFFAGGQYAVYDQKQKAFVAHEMMTEWNGWASNWVDGPQTVVNAGDGNLYFFSTNECMVFNVLEDKFEGAPYSISPDLPPSEFISNIDDGPPSEDIISGPAVSVSINNNTPKINTDNWCLTGNPPGNSDADLFADIIYMKNGDVGTEMVDETPQGARLAEIRVWGKWVIYGIQTILETPDGERIELPVLGVKKGATSSFKLDQGECLTGINGTHIGAEGRFIHTLQFETTKQQSKVFGSTRGKKTFSVNLPDATSFFGFAIQNENFLTSIGIKYVGYDDGSVAANDQTNSAAQGDDTFSNTEVKGNNKYAGEWRDDYKDFSRELIDLTWGSETAIRQLPTSEWLGKGVNILTLDPLNIADSKTNTPPIDLTTSDKKGGLDQNRVIPYGTYFNPISTGVEESKDKWIEKYSDFTKYYGTSVGVSGGAGPFQGSLSGSFSKMNNSKVGSSEIYLSRQITRKLFSIELKLFWREREFGKARQKLNLDFRDMVDNLEVPSSVPNKSFSSMRKGVALPSSIENIREQYQAVLDEYGNHFIQEAVFGGKYVRVTKITKKEYENSSEDKTGFKAAVSGGVGPISLGANTELENKTSSTTGSKSKTRESDIYPQGGGGSTDLKSWNAELKNSPVPIELDLLETYNLLDKKFFPNDPDIEKKKRILKMVTEQYIVDNGVNPSSPNGTFFTYKKPKKVTPPKAAEYKYTLTISSIHNSGSETFHYYGDISCDFIGDNVLGQSMWMMAEHNAVEVVQKTDFYIMEDYSIKLKEGQTGHFEVTGNLSERGWWPDYSISLGKKTKRVDLSDIPEGGKDFEIHGFAKGHKNGAIKFRIDKKLVN